MSDPQDKAPGLPEDLIKRFLREFQAHQLDAELARHHGGRVGVFDLDA